jgi:hypothetical protein
VVPAMVYSGVERNVQMKIPARRFADCVLKASHATIFFTLLLVISPGDATPKSMQLVIPGKCVAKICLDDNRASVQKLLGRSDTSKNLGAGREVDVWKNKHRASGNSLMVLYEENRVSEIHFTSKSFVTSEGVSVDSSFSEIKRVFPDGVEDEYAIFETGHNRADWIVKGSGITFTFAGDFEGPVVRIVVHKKNATKLFGYSDQPWYW